MAFSGNNQTIYNAVLNGAMAGMLAGATQQDAVTADYATMGAVATFFATQVDSQIATDANLSTGAGGTTIDPVAGVTTASLSAKAHAAFGLAFGYWFQRRPPVSAGISAAFFAVPAAAIAAAYAQCTAQYALAPGGSSLT